MLNRLFLVWVLLPAIVCGDLNSELNRVFNKLNSTSNVNSADIVNGQLAGYATSGGVTVKNKLINTQPLTVQLPHMDAGCGGIDIFTGGFSFINDQQLIDSLKSIGAASTGYAFMLALETVSPQIANTMKELQTWANRINTFNINSCEAASAMVGSVWPKDTLAKQHICRMWGGKTGEMADYLGGRHSCSEGKGQDKVSSGISGENSETIMWDGNVAWEALQKQSFFQSNERLAEFFMTLMGTIIVTNHDNKPAINSLPSKITDENFLQTLVRGGELEIYKCKQGEDQSRGRCLITVLDKEIVDKEEDAWLGKVQRNLTKIQGKILDDIPLSDSDRDFIAGSRVPLLRVVNVLTAYHKGYSPVDLLNLSDLVAMDLMLKYLREAIQVVREGAQHIRNSQVDSKYVDDYLKMLNTVEIQVARYEVQMDNRSSREWELIQKIQWIEDKIAAEISL